MRLYNVNCTMRSAGPQKWLPHLTGLRNLGPGADQRQSMQGGALEGLLRNVSGMEVQMQASRLSSMPRIIRVSLADGNP